MLSKSRGFHGVTSRRSAGSGDPLSSLFRSNWVIQCAGILRVRDRQCPRLSVSRSNVRDDQIASETERDMIVDCDRCEVRGGACQDCVITVLLGNLPSGVELDGPRRPELDALAEAGMAPRLQLVDRHTDDETTWSMTNFNACPRSDAERSATIGERSSRHVS
jgi:hypothetical protein